MSLKSKGINAERELIHKFWERGWAAVRVAGSGSSRYPSPDILAGNNIRKVAIECKAIRGRSKYFPSEEINNLNYFAVGFGAEPWVAVRFDNVDWFFVGTSDLEKTEKSYRVTLDNAKRFGLLFDELIR
ncbi:Holliday junction resolvase [Candidatus Woesearchaeota archaeon]|nr:Holliday junction resolvase [Candidatus Woesearchaeota archaeon]